MNILFIYSLQDCESLSKPLGSPEYLQFGISYISALLKSHGHKTKLVVLSKLSGKKNNRKVIDVCIRDFQPRLVCFTSVSSEYDFISGIAKHVKNKYNNLYLLIGGVHASLNPEETIKADFDAVCIGEGEFPTLELVNSLENNLSPSGILNLWIKHKAGIERNSPRPFLSDLDSLPSLDRKIWREWTVDNSHSRQAVLLGRGCLFDCSYCCNHALKKISAGRYVRFRSPDNIVTEIKELADRYPSQREIYLEVESFYADKKWALELCSKLENLNRALTIPLSFGVNLRITPNTDYEELFMACKKSNFRFINIGLESGSGKIRSSVLRRNYSNQDVINTVRLARQFGLEVGFFNLIGIPGETPTEFQETIELNRACLPNWTNTSIFFPYPGTELYSLCKEKGFLDKNFDTERERDKAILNLPDFPREKVQASYEWFYFNIYKGHKPLYNLLINVLVMKLRSRPKLFYLYKALRRSHLFSAIRLIIKRFSKISPG